MALPDYHFMPAPLWLITVFHVLTLTLHLSAMNFLFGGLVVILASRIRDKWQNPAVLDYVRLLPSSVAATVTLGVAPLLFLQLTFQRPVYSASIVSAWFWLLVIVAVIVAYYLIYASAFKSRRGGALGGMLALAAVLLTYVSIIYSSVFAMAEKPGVYRALYAANQSGWVINTDIGHWLFRWLHMASGVVAVGGFWVGVIGRKNAAVFGVAKRFFLGAAVTAIVLGVVYLMSLGDYLRPLMHSAGIWFLLASFVLTLGAMHFFFRKQLLPSGLALFASLLGMVSLRHVLRLVVLPEALHPSRVPVRPQWDVFGLFLGCFVIALGVVGYMLKLFFGARRRA